MSENKPAADNRLKHILEAALLAAGEPLSLTQLGALFEEDGQPAASQLREALAELAADCEDRGVELKEVASGYRLQVKESLQPWVAKLWTEKPQRYSRALLETLALIAYRQPITRGEIEAVRGVSVRSSIIRTLQEREWIRIVGHRDVPGKPALFGTTKQFLDYFNLKSLDELPTLAEIKDLDNLEPELELEDRAAANDDVAGDADEASTADGSAALEADGATDDPDADSGTGRVEAAEDEDAA